MALTYTPEAKLGRDCPEFDLPTVDGKRFGKSQLKNAKASVILFICNHCPYVKAIEDRLLVLAREYQAKGVQFVGICANDSSEQPEDAPEALLKRWSEKNYGFPYCVDESQQVAKAFAAVCTPDIYVYDVYLKLRYRGRLDDSWRDPARVQRQELKAALDDLLGGKALSPQQNPSMGCSIKWRE